MVDDIREKIASSFMKVKEDISFLKEEINKLKEFVFLKNNEILTLKAEIRALNLLLNEKLEQKQQNSIGNDRVINNHQQSSTIINNHQQSQIILEDPKIKPLRMILENKFRALTDREFSVFIAIYQLEEEKNKVHYGDIASKLNLTEATVRNYITSLLNKEIPIEREREFNKKASFYIKKEFKDLNIASKLLELRQFNRKAVEK